MNHPQELKYTRSHEWVKMVDDTTALVGLTDYAQHSLGDLVFVNLPQVGDEVAKEEAFGDVESVKAVSDVFSPFDGGGFQGKRRTAGRTWQNQRRPLWRMAH